MTGYKKLLLIFLIPFVLAVSLAFLGDYFFPPSIFLSKMSQSESFGFYHGHDESSWTETFYIFLIIGLFIVSVILPPLITWREYQKQKTERKSKSLIINGNN